MKKININETVFVFLTNHGIDVLRNNPAGKWIKINAVKGYTEIQLWELCQIFGPYMYNGAKQCFEDNTIYFEIPE